MEAWASFLAMNFQDQAVIQFIPTDVQARA